MTTAAHEQWRPALLLTRSFVTDYVRNPVNLIMLVIVPLVFVLVAAGSIADAMELLRGSPGIATQTATAGWAAGFLSGLAMYFQIRSARAADKRMLLAGLPAARLLAARAGTGLLMAGLVSAVALLALVVRTGIDHPARVIIGTLMFALIYLAIGALVGVGVSNPVNGAVVILLIWMIDVFVGPAGSGGDYVLTRWFPTHFVTLWMVDTPSHHAGRLGDLGLASVWLVGALVVAAVCVAAGSRTARRPHRSAGQLLTALRLGLVDLRRNAVLLVLLVLVPAVFVLLAKVTTPGRPLPVAVTENGVTSTESFWFPDVHAGAMAPIGIGALAALVGMFVVVDAAGGDRRLRLSGYRTSHYGGHIGGHGYCLRPQTVARIYRCQPARGGHLCASRCGHRTTLRQGRRSVRGVLNPVPGPGHHPKPDAASRAAGMGSLPTRLRPDAGAFRYRPDRALRPNGPSPGGIGLARWPADRRHGGARPQRQVDITQEWLWNVTDATGSPPPAPGNADQSRCRTSEPVVVKRVNVASVQARS
jgi:hypothetical protein